MGTLQPLVQPTAVGGGKGAYTYLVETDGTNITVYDNTGSTVYGPTTDVVAAIQYAADQIGTNGGTIFIRKGIYEISEVNKRILLPSNITLKGEGIDSTILRVTTAEGSGGWTDWRGLIENKNTGATNIHIMDLSIEMPNEYDLEVGGTPAQVYNICGIVYYGVTNSSIQRCRFYKIPGYSIRIRGDVAEYANQNILIKGCKFITSTWGPIIEGQYTRNVLFTECYSEDQYVGISLWGCKDVVVSNNITYRNDNNKRFGLAGAAGIMPEQAPLENVAIIGNVLLDEEHGISTTANAGEYVRNLTIVGNIIRVEATDLTYGIGIDLGQIKDSVIAGNIITKPKKGLIIGSSSNCVIMGNILRETRTSDLGFQISGSYHTIKNNQLIDVGTGASYTIWINATKSLFEGNILYDSDGTHSWHGFYLTDSAHENILRNNYIYNHNVGINLLTGADYNKIYDNILEANGTAISNSGTGNIIKRNIGYATENNGIATFSGDGTTTTFTIAHGLVGTPTVYKVQPASADAAGDFYVTADSTNLTVTYKTAPPSGTDNIVLVWQTEV